MFFFSGNEENTPSTATEETPFESIKHIREDGSEFWYARELQNVLSYKKWENFNKVIEKAKVSCEGSNNTVSLHFPDIRKMYPLSNGGANEYLDYELSRYACYLIAMNGDSRKKVIALAQTYFAVKTREQELAENFEQLSEDKKRIEIRRDLKTHNTSLAEAAQLAGVNKGVDYAIFQNHGYKGLYGGLTAKDIHAKKKLKESQKILDHMGSTELAANLFRATQTDEKLRRENIKGKEQANRTHYEVGKKVRQTIKELGGTMPEDLPTPKESIKQLEKKQKKLLE